MCQAGFQYVPVASITTWVTPWDAIHSERATSSPTVFVGPAILPDPVLLGSNASDELVLPGIEPSTAGMHNFHSGLQSGQRRGARSDSKSRKRPLGVQPSVASRNLESLYQVETENSVLVCFEAREGPLMQDPGDPIYA